MSNIVAIARKELRSYFASPIGYIVLGFFAILYGVFYVVMFMVTNSDNKVDEPSFDEYKSAIFKGFENCTVKKEGPPSRKLEGYR